MTDELMDKRTNRTSNIEHPTSNIEWGTTKNQPRKAILLAAGFGSRMQPMSYDTPKPLMQLWGIPLLPIFENLITVFPELNPLQQGLASKGLTLYFWISLL